jgi:hypothetical protein
MKRRSQRVNLCTIAVVVIGTCAVLYLPVPSRLIDLIGRPTTGMLSSSQPAPDGGSVLLLTGAGLYGVGPYGVVHISPDGGSVVILLTGAGLYEMAYLPASIRPVKFYPTPDGFGLAGVNASGRVTPIPLREKVTNLKPEDLSQYDPIAADILRRRTSADLLEQQSALESQVRQQQSLLESQVRAVALALLTPLLLLLIVGYSAWRRDNALAQSNGVPAGEELMGQAWSQRPVARLVWCTAKLLPSGQRAFYVETTCGNLDATESPLERTVYLISELLQMPKTAWICRTELRQRGPTR